MPLRERWGLELTAASEQARAAYVAGPDGILMATADPKQHLHASIEEDPEFALAHAALARFHQLTGRSQEPRQSAERAAELATSTSAREQRHVEIFRLQVSEKSPDALDDELQLRTANGQRLSFEATLAGSAFMFGENDRRPKPG